jgi:hypothetical protein
MSILLQVLYYGESATTITVVDNPVKHYFEQDMSCNAFFVAYARVTLKDGIVTRMTGFSLQRNVYMPQRISEIKARAIVKQEVIGIDWIV